MKKAIIISLLMIYWAGVGIEETIRRLGLFPGTTDEKAGVVIGFAVSGLISSLFLLFLWRKANGWVAKTFIVLGYFSITTVAYIFGISGLSIVNKLQRMGVNQFIIYYFLAPLSIGLFGSIPIIGNTLVGAVMGKFAQYIHKNYIAGK